MRGEGRFAGLLRTDASPQGDERSEIAKERTSTPIERRRPVVGSRAKGCAGAQHVCARLEAVFGRSARRRVERPHRCETLQSHSEPTSQKRLGIERERFVLRARRGLRPRALNRLAIDDLDLFDSSAMRKHRRDVRSRQENLLQTLERGEGASEKEDRRTALSAQRVQRVCGLRSRLPTRSEPRARCSIEVTRSKRSGASGRRFRANETIGSRKRQGHDDPHAVRGRS